MKRIVVTGGSGKLGRACVQDLIEHGYDVINADIVAPKEILLPVFQDRLGEHGSSQRAPRGDGL